MAVDILAGQLLLWYKELVYSQHIQIYLNVLKWFELELLNNSCHEETGGYTW